MSTRIEELKEIIKAYGILINDKNEYMCVLHDTPRSFEWCKQKCPRYRTCSTITWADDNLKVKKEIESYEECRKESTNE